MTRRTVGAASAASVVEAGRAALGVWHLSRAVRGREHAVLHGVLGVRQLVQAALVARAGTADAHTLSAVVDALHGTSMVPLALDPRRRGFALQQVWIAAALTVAEVALVGRGRRR